MVGAEDCGSMKTYGTQGRPRAGGYPAKQGWKGKVQFAGGRWAFEMTIFGKWFYQREVLYLKFSRLVNFNGAFAGLIMVHLEALQYLACSLFCYF